MKTNLTVLLLSASVAVAGQWTLIWDDPNAPGSIAHYEVSEIAGGATNLVGLSPTNGLLFTNVTAGAHVYQVNCVSTDGLKSDPSTNATFSFPSKAGNLKVK